MRIGGRGQSGHSLHNFIEFGNYFYFLHMMRNFQSNFCFLCLRIWEQNHHGHHSHLVLEAPHLQVVMNLFTMFFIQHRIKLSRKQNVHPSINSSKLHLLNAVLLQVVLENKFLRGYFPQGTESSRE